MEGHTLEFSASENLSWSQDYDQISLDCWLLCNPFFAQFVSCWFLIFYSEHVQIDVLLTELAVIDIFISFSV